MRSIRLHLPYSYICAPCYYRLAKHLLFQTTHENAFAENKRSFASSPNFAGREEDEPNKHERQEERGAMSQRLQEMSERNLEAGGRSAQRSFEEAGFSEELRRELEARIEDSKFKSDNAAAFAQLNLPVIQKDMRRLLRGMLKQISSQALVKAPER